MFKFLSKYAMIKAQKVKPHVGLAQKGGFDFDNIIIFGVYKPNFIKEGFL